MIFKKKTLNIAISLVLACSGYSFADIDSTQDKNNNLITENFKNNNLNEKLLSSTPTVQLPNTSLSKQRLAVSSFFISPVSGSLSTGYTVDTLNKLYGLGYKLKLSLNYQYGKTSSYLSSDKRSSWDLSLPSIYINDIGSGAVEKTVCIKLNGANYTINPKYVTIETNDKVTLTSAFNEIGSGKTPIDFFIYSHATGNKYAPNLKKISVSQLSDGSFVITSVDGSIHIKTTIKLC